MSLKKVIENGLQTAIDHSIFNNENVVDFLVEFIGVRKDAVKEWACLKRVPLGLGSIKLHYFLTRIGCADRNVPGIKDDILNEFREFVALGVFDLENSYKLLGFSEQSNLIRVITGGSGTTLGRVEQMGLMLKNHKVRFKEALNIFDEKFESIRAKESITPSDSNVGLGVDLDTVFSILPGAIRTVHFFAENLASDNCTAKDRENFRELLRKGELNEVTMCLSKLSGERARAQIIQSENNPL